MNEHFQSVEGDTEAEIIESFGGPELYAHGAVIRPIEGPDVEIVFYVTRRRSEAIERYEVARMRMPLAGFDQSLNSALARWKEARKRH